MTQNASNEAVFDVNAEQFEERVLRASMELPVIAYFTAPWCGPCKQLGPILENAVRSAGGKILMGRINLDENQELAMALRIQSVPTIFAFFQGRPVDAFQGAVPESQVKNFISKLVEISRQARPDALDIPEALKNAAQILAAGDLAGAQAIYGQILQQDENNAQAYVGLIRIFITAGQIEQAQNFIDNAPQEISKNSAFSEARTALDLAKEKPQGSLEELVAKVNKNPEDFQARYDLALAEFSAGRKEEAIDNLIEILRKNREWNEQQARKQLLKIFEALGPADPLTIQGRRKLSSVLFS